MKILLCIMMMLSGSLAYKNSDQYINEINNKQNLWKAGRNFPENTPLSHIRSLLGAKTLPKHTFDSIPVVKHETDKNVTKPDSFDARTKWPKCESIKNVYDQSACGSCWAVSVASAITDRICIHSDSKVQPVISAQNIMGCSPYSSGCNGGLAYYAWRHWNISGIVTGGAYKSNEGCQPYPYPPCKHDGTFTSNKPECSTRYPSPSCRLHCDNSSLNYSSNLYYGNLPYRLANGETNIQEEIMKNGPIVATFMVHADFVYYRSGIYMNTTADYYGKHAVRVIGWGEENSTKYWLVVNSWNEDWGDKGLFKIRRGTNECDFESELTAGIPI